MILFSIVIALLLSAVFSGMEIAFLSANKLSIDIERARGTRRGRILSRFYDNPAHFISSMLVGNNIALVFYASLMSDVLSPSVDGFMRGIGLPEGDLLKLLLITVASTLVVLIFGEFLPKILFRMFAQRTLLALALPVHLVQKLLAPFTFVMVSFSTWLLNLFMRTPAEPMKTTYTPLDLDAFVRSADLGDEQSVDAEMFGNALFLKETRVVKCMRPRADIVAVDEASSIDGLRQLFTETSVSRILVYRGTLDDVIGYVHHQAMLKQPASIAGTGIVMPIETVPETMSAVKMMDLFIKKSINIACVVDEFGNTAGVITLEDVLEEIFGDIHDEHDQNDYVDKYNPEDGNYVFSTRLEISFLNEKYPELNLPEGDYNTLAGYLSEHFGGVPEWREEKIVDGRYRIRCEIVNDDKIEVVRLSLYGEDRENRDDEA